MQRMICICCKRSPTHDCCHDYVVVIQRYFRYEKEGEALLVLLASEEEAMVEQLEGKKIPIQKIRCVEPLLSTALCNGRPLI